MATWDGWTLDWYRQLFADELLLAALGRSIGVAAATTLIAVLLGTPAAIALARYRFRGEGLYGALLRIPLVIPEIVMASSLVLFFGMAGVRLSLTTVVIAHVAFSLSYMILTLQARLADFDPSLEEAAMDLGATPWQTFRLVTWPLLMPGVVSGSLLVFTLSLDDYVITSFVAGAGATTLPLVIYSMLKLGVTPEINAASTVLLVFTVVMVGVSHALGGTRHET
jgi:spermidine/putrescine transport system permease protein